MTDWNDPKYQDSILKKGQRRPTARPNSVSRGQGPVKPPMLCTNCGKPVFSRAANHCTCLMWDVGKINKEVT